MTCFTGPSVAFIPNVALRGTFRIGRGFASRRPSVEAAPVRTLRRCRVVAVDNLYPKPTEPQEDDDSPAPNASSYLDNLTRRSSAQSNVSEPVSSATSWAAAATPDSTAPPSTEPPLYSPPSPVTTPTVTTATKSHFEGAARALWRFGWATWWIQLVLSIIAGIILLFSFAFPGVNVRSSASAVGFLLGGAGVVIGFISLFWTYSYTRLSLWLSRSTNLTSQTANSRITASLRIGLLCAIAGLIVSLLGLQATVGTLLARLFSAGIATTPAASYPGGVAPSVVQPVDVLVVQASANSMMGLLAALITTIWLRTRARKWEEKSQTSS